MSDPPTSLWLWGTLPHGPAVAVVGTRTPSRQALDFTTALVHDLGRAGVSILSGGALGIDARAHEAALEVGAHTLVVAPAGLSRPYPAAHSELFARVLSSGGGYLSVTPDGNVAEQWCFFRRNSVLAAMAHVVVAVESGVRSGTRNTTARARRLGRPVFWPPASPWDKRRAGFLVEYRLGGVELLRDARDVLGCLKAQRLYGVGSGPQLELESVWLEAEEPLAEAAAAPKGAASEPTRVRRRPSRGASPEPAAPAASEAAALSPEALGPAVLEQLRQAPHTAEGLSLAIGAARLELERALVDLTLRGVIERDPLGRFCLAR